MQPNQLSLIAEIINENFDSNLYENVTSIANLGNIFCGFSTSNFEKINKNTIRYLFIYLSYVWVATIKIFNPVTNNIN